MIFVNVACWIIIQILNTMFKNKKQT